MVKQAGRKTGKFSDMYKAPPEPSTIDWDAIREARKRRLDEEIARGVDNAETRAHLLEQNRASELPSKPLPMRKSRAKPKGTGPGRGGRPKFSRHQMREMWKEGKTTREISAELGCALSTVQVGLKGMPEYDPHRDKGKMNKGGRPPRTHCPKGHDMKVHGRQVKGGRGRYCALCKSEADKANYEKRMGR